MHTIKKGLDLPIAGQPEQTISQAALPRKVALLADDYVGLRPTMSVAVGDAVKRGQTLFEDKKTPGVRYAAPGAGTVVAVNRGAKRAFQSIVIELTESERSGSPTDADFASFAAYTGKNPAGLSRDEIRDLLVESGMWTAFRTRPFSRVPAVDSKPRSIFVTAIDTNPLSPSVEAVLKGRDHEFELGLICVAKLTDGRTYLCKSAGAAVPVNPNLGVQVEEFAGPHPAGTVGMHIHRLDPVSRNKMVWHIGYQDVLSIGRLVSTGKLDVERVVSLAGPTVKRPRLVKTRAGASLDELTANELEAVENRVISGSVLSGRTAMGDILGYLGRYHLQITALEEGHKREFLGWIAPGKSKFSVIPVFLSRLLGAKSFRFTTTTNGSARAMVPIGMYESVMPMDIQPTFLLRALIMGDIERAELLGCLELDEEDLALCTFVCPGKYDYGQILRENLETIYKEG
ncbi:MAG: Na(+)-translocating NADH-quinone reductase subunit A [Candidatus Hydrogenedentes bacterium]|nr:Na(+)-translocating NADH-quinone reductase subunit A [Candidatus Hydrogenedentota bacterium]